MSRAGIGAGRPGSAAITCDQLSFALCLQLTSAAAESSLVMKDSSNPFARSTGYRLAEWAACAALHYTGLDRRLGPLHARTGQVGAILMYHRVHPDSTGTPWHRS